VGGGAFNQANGQLSTIPGGYYNLANGNSSVAVGGERNQASGAYSFAAGWGAEATHDRSFVWSSYGSAHSAFADRFHVFASNGFSVDYSTQNADGNGSRWVKITPLIPGLTISTWTGASLSDGGTWNNASDRSRKTNFQPIDTLEVLDSVTTLPLQTWSYTNELTVRHLGPTAQDFRAAFALGADDKSFGTIDADGVALAAIQGLNQKMVEEAIDKEAQIASLQRALNELQERVAALERINRE
jgi:hypothetical protein